MGKRKHDIERYLRGEMTPAEMHALEKEALSDPFLSDAMEGAGSSGTENFLYDLKDLRSSFQNRPGRRKTKILSTWNLSLGIAAGLILLAVSSVYIISNITQQKREVLASKQDETDVEAVKSAEQKASVDSTVQADQLLSLKKPQQSISSGDAKPINGPEKNKQPDSKPLGGVADTKASAPVAEPIAETESISKEAEEIVEAPTEIVASEKSERKKEALSEPVAKGNTASKDNSIQSATPLGGQVAFEKYLKEKRIYPAKAKEKKIEGMVSVQFTVDANGKLKDFTILKSLGYGCDEEVIRLIKEGPVWSPSKRNNQPVSDVVKVSLTFDLPD